MGDIRIKEPDLDPTLRKGFEKGFHLQILYMNHLNKSALEPKATLTSFTLQSEATKNAGTTLKEIRSKAGPAVEKKWSFCMANGAVIHEDHTLGYYVSLSPTGVTELLGLPKASPKKPAEMPAEKPDEKKPGEAPAEKPAEKPAQKPEAEQPAALPTTATITVLMVSANSVAPPTGGRDTQLAWLKDNKPDLKFSASNVPDFKAPGVPSDYKAEYLSSEAWAPGPGAFSGKTSDPGLLDCIIDMTMKDWHTIMLLNKLVYGSDIRSSRQDPSGKTQLGNSAGLEITNARLPAFSLKSGVPAAELELPEWAEVMDSPQITITEIRSDLQSSLAKSAFSARSLEILTGGGTPMISAGVSAGVAVESQSASGLTEGQKRTEYFATYNESCTSTTTLHFSANMSIQFPRVRVFLDETTLQVSQQCKAALESLERTKSIDELLGFQRRFGRSSKQYGVPALLTRAGTLFATEIVLGGRLETSKYAKTEFESSNSLEKDALKASVGANFTSPSFALTSKVTSETVNKEEKTALDLSSEAALSWTARGGNTLLCANPPLWAASVAVFRNWRTIQQDEVIPLQTLLGRFEEFKGVPALFKEILDAYNSTLPETIIPLPKMDASKAWTETTKIRLFISGGAVSQVEKQSDLRISDPGIFYPPESLFSVRDGNPESNGGRFVRGLRCDYPVALFLGDAPDTLGPTYNSSSVNIATGTWQKQSANSGKVRFSLRHVSASGAWKPLPESFFANGDKVKLYCHAFDKEPFKIKSPPVASAHPAMYSARGRKLGFSTPTNVITSVSGWEEAVFTVEFA